jgi:amidase
LAAARARIEELAELHAFISLSDERFVEAQAGPIVAVKDLIDVRGLPTTAGSLSSAIAPATADASVVTHVREAGGIVVGKTNLYELGFGVNSHNPHYGDIVNPVDRERSAGGSSGGSAVAVATGMCDWAVGTDTGGSIRIPASLCGVVGFKPTRDLISTRGVLPLSPSLDTVGSLARNVGTAARALGILADRPLSLNAGLHPRLAVPRDWVDERGLDGPTRAVWTAVAGALPTVDLPALERMSGLASALLEWEAAAVHESAFVGRPGRYGPEVSARLGRAIAERRRGTEADYSKMIFGMRELSAQVELALEGWDALILPASACVAPLLSERRIREPLVRFMRPFNLTGHPAIVIPAAGSGLPVGVQLVGRLGGEGLLASAALALERAWAEDRGRPKA